MFRRQLDVLCIGDTTTDCFIRLKDAHVHCNLDKDNCELCLSFGSKIPFEYVKIIKAVGNAANAATAGARLGLYSALVSDIGDDIQGKECLDDLQNDHVVTKFIRKHKGKPTNYHFVLWYDTERTILVDHVKYDYVLPNFPEPKWIYLTSLAANSDNYVNQIARYLDQHPKVKLAFQPGTYQLKSGINHFKEIYRRTEVLVLNLEEAATLLQSDKSEPKLLLKKLHELGVKVVLITDGMKGSYMYEGDHYYFMPMYPDPRPAVERTGCGDAYAATFISALIKGLPILEALTWAPVNPMSVAQFIGSKEGLLTEKDMEWWLKRAPENYKPTII